MRRSVRTRVGIVSAVGALMGGILIAVLLIGPAAGPRAAAQTTIGTPGTPAMMTSPSGVYQDFINKLSANLGINDPAKVDQAIKTTLNQMVDEETAAGRIKGQQVANLIKSQINSGAFATVVAALFHELETLTGGQAPQATAPIVVPTMVGTPSA